MSKPELLIFDFDGVLIDSEQMGCQVWADMFGKLGIDVSVETMLTHYTGKSGPNICSQVENDYGCSLPVDFLDQVNTAVEGLFETELDVVNGVHETMEKLRLPMCVASGSRPERLFQCLRVTGLDKYFNKENVFSSHEVKNGKPAPDIFLYAAKKMNVAPEKCIVIEDSIAGVQAGKAAGMYVLGFSGGSHCREDHPGKLKTVGADVNFSSFALLPEIIASLDI